MQQYYLHKYGNLEAVSILIEADAEEVNGHFQVLLDYFQVKFNRDSRLCDNRRRGARALLEERARRRRLRGGDGDVDEGEAPEGSDAPLTGGGEGGGGRPSLYRRLHDSFLSLTRRREQRALYWDPLEPGDIYRSIWFWSYSGSTTEPPCFEDVKWVSP